MSIQKIKGVEVVRKGSPLPKYGWRQVRVGQLPAFGDRMLDGDEFCGLSSVACGAEIPITKYETVIRHPHVRKVLSRYKMPKPGDQ